MFGSVAVVILTNCGHRDIESLMTGQLLGEFIKSDIFYVFVLNIM